MSSAAKVNLEGELLVVPEIRQLVDDVTDLIKLEIVQTVRGVQTPLPATRPGMARSVEQAGSQAGQIVLKRLSQLPAARRDAARSAFTLTPALKRSAQRLGVITDARTATARQPLLRQVDLTRQFGAAARIFQDRTRLNGLLSRLSLLPGATTGGGAVANRGIRFLLHEVTCVKETKEAGKDEIALGGVAVDADETTTVIPESHLGKFKTGDRRTFSPAKELTTFTFEGDFPKNFAVFVALAEKDLGGFSAFLAEFYESVRDQVTVILTAIGAAAGAWIGTQVGAGLGAAIGGPIGVVIGALAGAILGALVGWIVSVTQDDVFTPQVAGLMLPSAEADFGATGLSSGRETLTFVDHGGTYQVHYSWELRR